MGRKSNDLESVELRIATNPLIVAYLRKLVQTGLYGKNPTEAAERLVAEKIRDLSANHELGKPTYQKGKDANKQ